MPKKLYLYLFPLLCFSTISAAAQKPFIEGIITYKVSITAPGDNEGGNRHTGKYIITVKGDQFRKELKMNNGFTYTSLHTNGTIYILRDAGDRKFAIETDKQRTEEKNAKYRDFKLKNGSVTKTIAGKQAHKAIVTYPNGDTSEILYTTDWEPRAGLFDKFPGIKFLPLSYTHENNDGMLMYFEAEKIEERPVENATFHIPEDYKLMTYQEYEQLKK